MKRLALVLVVFSLFVAGCGGGSGSVGGVGSTKSPWALAVHSVKFTSWVDSFISGYGYSPDPGYDWLLIDISITNTRDTGASLNWFLDGFVLVVGNLKYDQRLQLNDPPGHIDTSFNPKQTKSGFIAFEVPEGTSVSNAVLRFEPYGGSDVVVQLKGIPIL